MTEPNYEADIDTPDTTLGKETTMTISLTQLVSGYLLEDDLGHSQVIHPKDALVHEEGQRHDEAIDKYNSSVREFFKDILKASEKLESDIAKDEDPLEVEVHGENVEAQTVKRTIFTNEDDLLYRAAKMAPERLRWVGDRFVILKKAAK